MSLRLTFLVCLSLVLGAATVGAAGGSTGAVRCSLWAAPFGDDANPGTQARPFATLGKLAATLTPGQTGCLPPGATFTKREVIAGAGTGAGRVTITTAPGGARAVLADGVETTQASRYLTLSNLSVLASESPTARSVSGTVILRGYATTFAGSDVGPGTLGEAGRSCVVLDHAGSAVVSGNVLHECNAGSKTLYGAGVLAANASGARITDNVIFGMPGGDGIAFSPNAQASSARRNLIVDNLGGIYFGGDAKLASRDTLVEQNVITRESRFDVHSGYAPNGPVGTRNRVRSNCIWSPGAVTASGVGFTMSANRKVNPRVVKVQGTYRLAASSPCKAYAPRP